MNEEKTHMQQFDYIFMRSGILVPGRRVPPDTIFRSLNQNNLKKERNKLCFIIFLNI
jgi:hypothetical protein